MKNILEVEKRINPAFLVDKQVIPVNAVTITYGGGMGGGSTTLYLRGHKFIDWVDNVAEVDPIAEFKQRLYKAHVVREVFRHMAYQKIDHTEQANYNKKVCSKAIREEWILLPEDVAPECVRFVENLSPNSEYRQLSREIVRTYKE